jgi:N-acetylmuramoyl-L-alanine amidase
VNWNFINIKSRFGRSKRALCDFKSLAAIVIVLTSWVFLLPADAAKTKQNHSVPEASSARLGGDNLRTRFVVDISNSIGYSVYVLPDPFRVIIDLPEINFQLPPGQGVSGRGLVTGYRFGLFSPGRSRIVIDASAPVLIEKSFVIPATTQKPARLVVDIVKTDRKTFLKNRQSQLEAQSSGRKFAAIPIPKRKPRASIVPGVNKKTPRPRARTAKKIIILDPGHGGIDSGAVGKGGVVEKKIVLSVARILGKILKATGRYEVRMTRNNDTFVPLRKRVEFARRKSGDLFISIHADTVKFSTVRGATIYTLSEKASDAEAAALAQKENRSDIIAGVNLAEENDVVTDILIDLVLRETKNHSIFFAQTIVKNLKGTTRTSKKPLRFAGFAVLKAPDIPSVLIELGFLSNGRDAKLLSSLRWRRKVSRAVAVSIDKYFRSKISN